MQSERTKEKSKPNQCLVLLPFAFKPASILIGTLAQSQGCCRIRVRGMINQLYQTGANDHQLYRTGANDHQFHM